jgi:hypothetical protein
VSCRLTIAPDDTQEIVREIDHTPEGTAIAGPDQDRPSTPTQSDDSDKSSAEPEKPHISRQVTPDQYFTSNPLQENILPGVPALSQLN